jgi:hypothetical protein
MAQVDRPVFRSVIFAVLFACAGVAFAQVPRTIAYQGYLTSNTGVPVNETKSIVFSLYDASSAGNLLWTETQSVTVTNGNYAVILGNGTAILGTEGYLRTVADLNWQVAGVGDYNGDGKSDILWRNTVTGENYLYPMNGLAILGTEGYIRTVADQNWQVKGTGDYDGDGKADILWRNAVTGENYIYPMDGTTIKPTEGYLRTVPQPNWQVQ